MPRVFHGFGPDGLSDSRRIPVRHRQGSLRRLIPQGKPGAAAGDDQVHLFLIAEPHKLLFQKLRLIRKDSPFHHLIACL